MSKDSGKTIEIPAPEVGEVITTQIAFTSVAPYSKVGRLNMLLNKKDHTMDIFEALTQDGMTFTACKLFNEIKGYYNFKTGLSTLPKDIREGMSASSVTLGLSLLVKFNIIKKVTQKKLDQIGTDTFDRQLIVKRGTFMINPGYFVPAQDHRRHINELWHAL